MTTISLMTTDQLLTIAEQPKLASGDQKSVVLSVEFDSEWNGFTKSAVFFTEDDKTPYEVIMPMDMCLIPHEVLDKEGTLYIGVRGVSVSDATVVKTSTLVKYKIEKGTPAGEGTTVEPTADVYQQLLNIYEDTKEIAQAVRDDFEAGAIPALQEQNKKAGFRFWVGTQEEYNAQWESLKENTFCVITDDTTKQDIINSIHEMKLVELNPLPIKYDVHEYDYFVVYMEDGRKLILNDITSDKSSLDLYARCAAYTDAGNVGIYEFHFYWGDGGYMCDTTFRIPGASAVSSFAYTSIYGGKIPKLQIEVG